jgi:REP element-mobilizing transposase RayT
MSLPPQNMRTFLVSSATWQRRPLLQAHAFCDLLLDVIRENTSKQRLQIHEFVFMRDHIHMILTPAPLERLKRGRRNLEVVEVFKKVMEAGSDRSGGG